MQRLVQSNTVQILKSKVSFSIFEQGKRLGSIISYVASQENDVICIKKVRLVNACSTNARYSLYLNIASHDARCIACFAKYNIIPSRLPPTLLT